ncbi:hypothetical protein J7399_14515 [Shimia sp. R9_1]|uniref:hypothetical protein n=1 Tax=unclassified Shimia TaxID=2630038 RepID=UPI001ADA6539|nr:MULTISPECIES: hypothetical protein [unclassified Shimia]MBO9402021.1 hypothetical protein [Shimia sp. R9_3]MBO9408648.1 hypothetical protein [Shimia sp. R9_1]
MDLSEFDPKGLIRESYRIEGIQLPECRSIFLDWALSLPVGADTQVAIEALRKAYGTDHPDHPMTEVLKDGQVQMSGTPRRRGGWRSRERG